MNPRQLKEYVLDTPALWAAEKNIHPNAISAAGFASYLAGEVLAGWERTRPEDERRAGVFWGATFLRLLGLAADGFDGSVARAHVTLGKPKDFNPWGQYLDGLIDRGETILTFASEEEKSLKAGESWQALMIAIDCILANINPKLRARIEGLGGRTQEQSTNILTFAGTHAGRMIFLLLASLEYEQIAPALGWAGIPFERGQHQVVRSLLHTYLFVCNAAVTAQRTRDLFKTIHNPSQIADEAIDSAGFKKSVADHALRETIYTGTTIGAVAMGSGVALRHWLGTRR